MAGSACGVKAHRCVGEGEGEGCKPSKAYSGALGELHEGDWSEEAAPEPCGAGAFHCFRMGWLAM